MFKCEVCDSKDFTLIEKGKHTGLYCEECGRWHKWLGKNELMMYQIKYNAKIIKQSKEEANNV